MIGKELIDTQNEFEAMIPSPASVYSYSIFLEIETHVNNLYEIDPNLWQLVGDFARCKLMYVPQGVSITKSNTVFEEYVHFNCLLISQNNKPTVSTYLKIDSDSCISFEERIFKDTKEIHLCNSSSPNIKFFQALMDHSRQYEIEEKPITYYEYHFRACLFENLKNSFNFIEQYASDNNFRLNSIGTSSLDVKFSSFEDSKFAYMYRDLILLLHLTLVIVCSFLFFSETTIVAKINILLCLVCLVFLTRIEHSNLKSIAQKYTNNLDLLNRFGWGYMFFHLNLSVPLKLQTETPWQEFISNYISNPLKVATYIVGFSFFQIIITTILLFLYA